MKNRLYIFVIVVLVFVLASCAQAVVTHSMTPTPELIRVKTVGDQEVISCPFDNFLVEYSKKAERLDNPMCDDEGGFLTISTEKNGTITARVNVLMNTPSANHVSLNYHFVRITTIDEVKTNTIFSDCTIKVGSHSTIPMIGLSATEFIVDEDETVKIICILDDLKITATFPVKVELVK